MPLAGKGRLPRTSLQHLPQGVSSFLENTLPFATACDKVGVEAEVLLAKMGPHGHGMVDAWTLPCEAWLARHGWARPAVTAVEVSAPASGAV